MSLLSMELDRPVNVKYLQYFMEFSKKDEMNILRQNMYILLTSSKVIAKFRFLAMLHISCLLPLSWMTGRTHELIHRRWGARQMGLVLDIFLSKMEFLHDNPGLILNENWMMTMFHGLFEHKCVDFEPLLELKECFRHLYEVKQMSLVGRESGAKRKKFPGITLYHVENTAGSRQDIIFMSSLATEINRPVNVKYLQYFMEFAKKDEMNILRHNLYILLTSSEVIAQCRFLAMPHLSCLLPLRWLAGRTHELSHRRWGCTPHGTCLGHITQEDGIPA